MKIFQARSVDADSTMMPQVFSWVDATIDESPGCNSPDDHCLVMFFNLPAMGVLSVAKWDYLVTMAANALNRFKRNAVALIVHANRASQKSRTIVKLRVFPNNKIIKYVPKLICCSTLCSEYLGSFSWPSPAQNKFPTKTAGRNDTKTNSDTKDEEKIKKDDEEPDQDAEDAEVCDVRYQLESLACTILQMKFEI